MDTPDLIQSVMKIRNLHVSYGPKPILRGASFNVMPNECLTLLGANGSGKSTSLNAICGLVCPVSGSIEFDGVELAGLSPHKIFAQGVAQVSQARDLFPDLTVADNLRLGAMRRAGSGALTRLDQIFSRFPRLAERRHQACRTLSGGEQQMVAIGRAMMSAPRVLLLDEPQAVCLPNFARKSPALLTS